MKVKEKDLEFIKLVLELKKEKIIMVVKGKDYYVLFEFDFCGECYENVLSCVEKYLDDVVLVGYLRVLIIYGKGIGVLRKGVQDFLKNYCSVKSFCFGEVGEGGLGVMVVELK